MPAHIKRDSRSGYWYLVDGYLDRSLKTKSKTQAEARLKAYNQDKFHLGRCETVKQYYDRWIERFVTPPTRPSLIRDHKQRFQRHILPRFGAVPLDQIYLADLREFKTELEKLQKANGKPLAVATIRNVIDASFRALFRDARGEIKSLEGRDPFLDIHWAPKKFDPPDPFSADEQQRILEAFLEHEPIYYPFVRFQFETGCRPSETVALSWADLLPAKRTVVINKSRYMGTDNSHPKTKHSGRRITISKELMALVQEMRRSWSTSEAKVFLNKFGAPINIDNFRCDYWTRVLDALEIPRRKFYSTRHTFITRCVEAGYKHKEIADYCGTSPQMIDDNYCSLQTLDPDREIIGKSAGREADSPMKKVASPTGFEPVLSA